MASNVRSFFKRVKARHKRVKFVHFMTHMLGKLIMGLGIGALLVDQLEPYVLALIVGGVLLHIPFWHHVYLRAGK